MELLLLHFSLELSFAVFSARFNFAGENLIMVALKLTENLNLIKIESFAV